MYVIIVGGGKVGYYLTRTLIEEEHEVLLVEKDRTRAAYLEREFGEVVLRGDGCEMRVMEQMGTNRADVMVAVTGDDEDNLVISQIAKRKFNVPRVIARINNPKNEDIFQRLGIDATVSGTKITRDLIEQQVESGCLIPLAALKNGNIEVVEADVTKDSPVVEKTIADLKLPEDAVIVSILRGKQVLLPTPKIKLQVSDTVLVLVSAEKEKELRKLFTPHITK